MTDQTTTPSAGDTAVSAPASDTAERMIPKARLDEEIAKRRAVEADLARLVEETVADIPEQFRELVPAGLGSAEKLAWIRKARSTGIFTTKVPATDTGRPTTTSQTVDLDALPTLAKIAAGYRR
jgi:hypothetical protein